MRLSYFLAIIIFLSACGPSKKITKTTSDYEKKINTMLVIIEKPPPLIVRDSVVTPDKQYTSPNFGLRRPNFVILHHTAQNSCEETLRAFADSAREVSSHYLICRDGTVHHLLNDYLRAWHAGNSKWGNTTDLNSSSIGIEIDNNGNEPFQPLQITSLISILQSLKDSFNIPASNFIGHADVAPSRKNDPSIYFPWELLSKQGFGNWYGDTSKIVIPAGFNPLIGLRIIGYDISKPDGAYQAFRIHFLQKFDSSPIRKNEEKIIYSLMLKAM